MGSCSDVGNHYHETAEWLAIDSVRFEVNITGAITFISTAHSANSTANMVQYHIDSSSKIIIITYYYQCMNTLLQLSLEVEIAVKKLLPRKYLRKMETFADECNSRTIVT